MQTKSGKKFVQVKSYTQARPSSEGPGHYRVVEVRQHIRTPPVTFERALEQFNLLLVDKK